MKRVSCVWSAAFQAPSSFCGHAERKSNVAGTERAACFSHMLRIHPLPASLGPFHVYFSAGYDAAIPATFGWISICVHHVFVGRARVRHAKTPTVSPNWPLSSDCNRFDG